MTAFVAEDDACGSGLAKPFRMRKDTGTKNHKSRQGEDLMRIGASTFIWVSHFSTDTLDLIDKVKAFGFDLIEICVEDPETIGAEKIRRRLEQVGLGVTICGAFGPSRDMSSDDPAIRDNAMLYSRQCIDIAVDLGSDIFVGPIYAGVGNTRLLDAAARRRQWRYSVESLSRVADHAAERGVKLALEPLNRFETDLVNTVEQGLRLVADVAHDHVGLLIDTFHMNIEEKSIPEAIRRAGKHIFEFHACSSDRGTPGEDHLPWPDIAAALRSAGYDGSLVIEAFTPSIKEIAKAVSLWRPLAESEDALARNGLAHLRRVFG
jgi:D-psicose/D-tagatose/L-ribulose 3-epimerase